MYLKTTLAFWGREKREFSLPAILILDEKFNVENREFEYLTTKNMLELFAD